MTYKIIDISQIDTREVLTYLDLNMKHDRDTHGLIQALDELVSKNWTKTKSEIDKTVQLAYEFKTKDLIYTGEIDVKRIYNLFENENNGVILFGNYSGLRVGKQGISIRRGCLGTEDDEIALINPTSVRIKRGGLGDYLHGTRRGEL